MDGISAQSKQKAFFVKSDPRSNDESIMHQRLAILQER